MRVSRRAFVDSALAAGAGAAMGGVDILARQLATPRTLKSRFPDLSRHFIFEYYPWYATNPYRHWNEANHRPPLEIASNYLPKLGAYDSRSTRVMQQHAAWIKAAGAGAINVSWWGRDSESDRLIPALMDVMAAHDIKVTFHLEPYRDHRALAYASDIDYLITQYGERRRWDSLLLLRHEDGAAGPVFKSFRTILPSTSTDCHGRVSDVADYAADSEWREQTDRVRAAFASQFTRVTLLADSLDMVRTRACGFDGIAIYDNYVRPDTWRTWAEACSARDLLFSFNVNPGFDRVANRRVDPGSCETSLPFEPAGVLFDWARPQDRTFAARASERRIGESFQTTVALQTDPLLADARRGFFLVYINSFNEWHEGHQFEPMKDLEQLTAEERAVGYHNPPDGAYRLEALRKLLADVVGPR
jgi:hypothetical protein